MRLRIVVAILILVRSLLGAVDGITQRSTRPLILWRSWRSESEGLVSLTLNGDISNVYQVANGSERVDIWAHYLIRTWLNLPLCSFSNATTSCGRVIFRLLIQKWTIPI